MDMDIENPKLEIEYPQSFLKTESTPFFKKDEATIS